MFILLERVTHVLGPVEIALWRFGGGAAVLGLIWWWTQREYRPSRREWVSIALMSLLFCAPPQIILPYLIHQGFGHSFFGPMVAPIPLITILVSIPLLGLLPTGRQLVGVLGGLACVWLIVDDGFDRGMSLTFVALTLSIPLSSALSNTVIKWKLGRVPAVPLTAMMLVAAGLWLAPLQFSPAAMDALHLAAPANLPTAGPTLLTWLYLFVLTVVGTGISTAVFVWMILERGPLFAGMTTYVVPVLALLWGMVDRERISPQQLAAIVGVLSMVALVQLGSRRAAVVAEPSSPPQPVTLPEAIVEAISPLPLGAEPQLVVAPAGAEFAAADPLATHPESQVA
jgi:drug/metabolite transporter (DMT)-like permease